MKEISRYSKTVGLFRVDLVNFGLITVRTLGVNQDFILAKQSVREGVRVESHLVEI